MLRHAKAKSFKMTASPRCISGVLVAVLGLAASVVAPTLPAASAQPPCPDIQVLFARGTGEAPGIGPTGQAFVDALRARTGDEYLDVYPVDYPASNHWETGLDGIRDTGAHIEFESASCPKTKMVLGGYSQGAAVMGFVTSVAVPDGVDPATVPKPLAPDIADHVAAVVLYGMPNVRAMNLLGEPPVVIGPTYAGKTIKVCVPDDPVCSDGLNFAAHHTYADDANFIGEGADFAANLLSPATAIPAGRA
jgi:cutinase